MLEPIERSNSSVAVADLSASNRTSELGITEDETRRFAQLSGDFNPLHLDPLLARRLTYGTNVVHGVHTLLRALDIFCRLVPGRRRFARLKAWFVEPLKHHERIGCHIISDSGNALRIEARRGGRKLLVVEAEFSDWDGEDDPPPSDCFPDEPCRELSFDEARNARGSVELQLEQQLLADLFPAVSRCFPASQLSNMIATTRVIGMLCPGLHSIFTKLRLQFKPSMGDGHTAQFATTRAFSDLSLLKVRFSSSDADGEMESFFRRPPVVQPSFRTIESAVTPGEFREHTALIVGGSRGLGEVVAKVIAAGGGRPIITYCHGQRDARDVRTEIRAGGGACEVLHWNVLSPPSETKLESRPTHIYYFATPQIGLTKTFAWDQGRFQSFCDYYVAGLQQTVAAVRRNCLTQDNPLVVFYPSTVLLDTGGSIAVEYAAAKAAGESLCQFLQYEQPNTRCVCQRLPQVLTDQTNTLVASESADPVVTLLEMIRTMSADSESSPVELIGACR